ncbi:hypothetical protein [Actinomadura meridiana]|uniref:hypothetical protein n=1 Tax=Actinomadura meridiana TaxID=559626 RepID=UPI0031EB3ECC
MSRIVAGRLDGGRDVRPFRVSVSATTTPSMVLSRIRCPVRSLRPRTAWSTPSHVPCSVP